MKKKISVLHIVGLMNRGGAEVMLMDIYRNINVDFTFDFLVNYKVKKGIRKGDFDNEIQSRGGRIKHIGTQWDLGPFQYFKEFKKIIKEINTPDIVHIHLNAKSGIIALAAKKAGVKHIIIHSHANLKFKGGLLSKIASHLELILQKRLIAIYGTCFWGCSYEANKSLFYKRLLTPEKTAIIKNAVDVNTYQKVLKASVKELKETYNCKENTIVLGNVGRVVKHKNVSFIIDVLYELNMQKIDFIFIFAGVDEQPEYLEKILNKAEIYGITDKIKYLGVRDDIPLVMNSFDIFIGPAFQEGFGLVALEAQAAGLPCILSKGFPKTVDMGLGLVKFLDNFEITKWVTAIKSAPIKNKDFEEIKQVIISKGFDSVSNTQKILNLYENLKHEKNKA